MIKKMNRQELEKFKTLFFHDLNFVSDLLGVSSREVTYRQFIKNVDNKDSYTPSTFNEVGGFINMRNTLVDDPRNPELLHGSRLINRFKNKISKDVGEQQFFKSEFIKEVESLLSHNEIIVHKSLNVKEKSKQLYKRTLVACISDTHFGANVSSAELADINSFDWQVASRRLALLAEQIISYKPDYRKDTDLVIQLNGDIIAGLIHNQEWFVSLLATQFAGTLCLLSQMISTVAQHFSKVRVVCTSGNHGRSMSKGDKGRANVHKWDSYETLVYIALREALKNSTPNVSFEIPEAPYAVYNVQGNNILQTHGDTVINAGNPGKSINMTSLNSQINNINASDKILGKTKVDIVCIGHVHVPTVQLLQNGCMLVINGCLSGTDPFAQSIGIFGNNPTQIIFESVKGHPVGDLRLLKLQDADKESRFDKIIKPFTDKF